MTYLTSSGLGPSSRTNGMSSMTIGTSLARPLISKAQIEIAHKEGAPYVAHGATGKGNDQVRFELSYYALDPNIQVISPWKDPLFLDEFVGRAALLAYAEDRGIPVKASADKPYSEDANLMHVSHEAGLLEDPGYPCPEDVFSYTVSPKDAPEAETVLEIHFRDGDPIRVGQQMGIGQVTAATQGE